MGEKKPINQVDEQQERNLLGRTRFELVAPHGWSCEAGPVQVNGQGIAVPVRHHSGRKGVFKCLKDPSDKNRLLFEREIDALSRINHPNVVTILTSSKGSDPWHITEAGIPFKAFWQSCVGSQPKTTDIANIGLRIIRGLSRGLAECHRAGLVHRDLKPSNVVMVSSEFDADACLIDFGIVWTTDSTTERHTDVSNPAGNARYSPDYQRLLQADYKPWVDVFALAQIFVWMMSDTSGKHQWQRPVHWRYLSYRDELGDTFTSALKAFAAACSLEQLCPRDGDSCNALLDTLFTSPDEKMALSVDIAAANQAVAVGTKQRLLDEAEDWEIIQASMTVADSLLLEVKQNLKDSLKALGVFNVTVVVDKSIQDSYQTEDRMAFDSAANVFEAHVTHPGTTTFQLMTLAVEPLRPSRSVFAPEAIRMNMFRLVIHRAGRTIRGGDYSFHGLADHGRWYAFGPSGDIYEFDRSWSGSPRMSSFEDIVSLCGAWACDPVVWERLANLGE